MSRYLTLWAAVLCALSFQTAALAAESAPPGIDLSTDYPALTLKAGETSTIALHLRNRATPPERLALSVDGVPTGWKATLLGNGRPVESAMPSSDDTLPLQLRLDIPQGDAQTRHTLTVHADGERRHLRLPIDTILADQRQEVRA